MNELVIRKFVTPEIVFGTGAIELAGQYIEKFSCRKAIVVTDPGVRQAGWADIACQSLAARNIEYLIYDNVCPNPRDQQVTEGAVTYLENACDCILAVGGGSPMDCAKGIGIIVSNNGNILDFEGVDKISSPMPPPGLHPHHRRDIR